MRSLITLGAGLIAAAAVAAPAGAATMPTVQVTVEDAAVKLSGHEHLGSGPVRLKVRRSGGEARSIAVIELKDGKAASDLGALGGLRDAAKVERTGRLVAGVTAELGRNRAVTFEAKAKTYVVVDISDERQAYAELKPGVTNSGAAFGANDARVDLRDDAIAIKPEAYLPRRGVVKVRNTGTRAHHAIALRLDRDTTVAEAHRALKKGRAIEKVGTPVELTGVISAGTRVDVETVFKPGRYVLTGGRDLLTSFKVR